MNILLLEDDVSLNRAIKKVLLLDNHKVSNYFDGNDALKNISSKFDLYILDVNVPHITGLELLDLIYTQNNNAKIIIITSNTDVQTLSKAYEFGCIDLLQKPFHLTELRIKINKLDAGINNLFPENNIDKNIQFTKKEKDLLTLLLEHKGSVVNYCLIDDNVYINSSMSMDALRALVRRLRKKLHNIIIDNAIDEGYIIK